MAGSVDEISKIFIPYYNVGLKTEFDRHIFEVDWLKAGMDQPHDYRAIDRGRMRGKGFIKRVSAKIISQNDAPAGLQAVPGNLGGGGGGGAADYCTGSADVLPPSRESPGGNSEGAVVQSGGGDTVIVVLPPAPSASSMAAVI